MSVCCHALQTIYFMSIKFNCQIFGMNQNIKKFAQNLNFLKYLINISNDQLDIHIIFEDIMASLYFTTNHLITEFSSCALG